MLQKIKTKFCDNEYLTKRNILNVSCLTLSCYFLYRLTKKKLKI